jgi:hypothetical protein
MRGIYYLPWHRRSGTRDHGLVSSDRPSLNLSDTLSPSTSVHHIKKRNRQSIFPRILASLKWPPREQVIFYPNEKYSRSARTRNYSISCVNKNHVILPKLAETDTHPTHNCGCSLLSKKLPSRHFPRGR